MLSSWSCIALSSSICFWSASCAACSSSICFWSSASIWFFISKSCVGVVVFCLLFSSALLLCKNFWYHSVLKYFLYLSLLLNLTIQFLFVNFELASSRRVSDSWTLIQISAFSSSLKKVISSSVGIQISWALGINDMIAHTTNKADTNHVANGNSFSFIFVLVIFYLYDYSENMYYIFKLMLFKVFLIISNFLIFVFNSLYGILIQNDYCLMH